MSNKLYNKAHPRFTWDDVKAWEDLHSQGMQYSEIAKEVGVSDGYIRGKCSIYRKKIKPILSDTPNTPEIPAPKKEEPKVIVKEKTLKDFSPREMIKYLYDLGYRVDEQGLYQLEIRKNRVNMKDVINNG